MTRRVGIIGYPLKHSVSPIFQQLAFENLGLDFSYHAWEIEPRQLEKDVRRLVRDDIAGFNVTIPYKTSIIPLLDNSSDLAELAGAVNTVVIEDGSLSGHNTDIGGFMRSIKQDASFSCSSKNILVIGAGGAARAVLVAMSMEGPSSLTVTSRNLEKSKLLCKRIEDRLSIPIRPLDQKNMSTVSLKSDLIVNCTPLGMKHGKYENETPLASELISPNSLVVDLVYNPIDTPLLKEARKAGASTQGGLPMLIYQGAMSFKLWTGKEAPIDLMLSEARKFLENDALKE